jgi:hypothetical protein
LGEEVVNPINQIAAHISEATAGLRQAMSQIQLPVLPAAPLAGPASNDGEEILARLREQPELAEVFLEAIDLVTMKDAHYGGAWRTQGYMGNVARVLSKVSRLKTMMWCDEDPDEALEEPIMDTLVDLINLAAFTVVNLREGNRWGAQT